jgi:hypothetical protein
MNNTPRNIRTTLRQQVITPLAEAIVGLRDLDKLGQLVAAPAIIRLTGRTITTARHMQVLDVKAQVLPGVEAIEAFATVNVDGRYHALAARVEVRNRRPVVVHFETTM